MNISLYFSLSTSITTSHILINKVKGVGEERKLQASLAIKKWKTGRDEN